jgi:hypothetical protein
MPILAAFCRSFSRNLVWTQLPTAGASASAVLVLAFFAATAAAPVAEELLLPMAAALKKALSQNGSKDARQGQSSRRKTMTAAEWGKQILPLSSFIPPRKNLVSS